MDKIKNIILASIETKQQVLQNAELLATVEKVIEIITIAFKKGNRVYFCGNGGSAADAQHLAAEFSGRLLWLSDWRRQRLIFACASRLCVANHWPLRGCWH